MAKIKHLIGLKGISSNGIDIIQTLPSRAAIVRKINEIIDIINPLLNEEKTNPNYRELSEGLGTCVPFGGMCLTKGDCDDCSVMEAYSIYGKGEK